MATQLGQESPRFRDPNLSEDERLRDLIAQLTVDEKIACLGTNPSVPRLGIRASGHVEGLHGLSQGGPANWTPRRKVPTTIFPQSYGLGATWDPDLIRKVGAVEGFECRYIFQSDKYRQAGIVVRAPNADLGRDPRWGRTEECFGEDPFLTGSLTVAFVKGLQGDHPKVWLSASLLKHFLANSNENTRTFSSSNMDARQWREYYSVPFRMGIVQGGARAYMAAYNAVNGTPCHLHPMLKEITVKEWGQDGIICTDGGGMGLLVSDHKACATKAEATARIVQSGIGQFLDDFRAPAREALEKGMLSEADMDAVLVGTFRVMLRLGLLDPPDENPYAEVGKGPEPWETEAHRSLVREATRKSIVLLKNEGILPLDDGKLEKIAVIGRWADRVHLDWYSGMPPYRVTPLEGIRARAKGCDVVFAADGREAIEAAKSADVAIVLCGNHPTGNDGWAKVERKSDGKEAVDRESIDLEDEALIQQVHAANPNTVVVLVSSFPYAINWSQSHVPAILHMSHNSQEQGNGLADVLFGDFNPAGRLTQTWPQSLEQLPPLEDYDLRKGRTYLYSEHEPLYPFGFGLSYATFAYRGLQLSKSEIRGGGALTATIEVENTGHRDGEEVVQLYVRFPASQVYRPLKQLRAFRRVSIPAGKTAKVELEVQADDLRYWDEAAQGWQLEPGPVEILVGPNSRDIALRQTLNAKVDP